MPHCKLTKPFVVCKIATHKLKKKKKALKVRKLHLYLFNLFLLLIQRGTIQVQQCGGNTDGKVVGIHLVCVSTLQDVMKDTHKMLQEDSIRPRKLVCYPGSKIEKAAFKNENNP